MRRLSALVALALAVTSCSNGSQEASPFVGLWASEGFGTYMVIEGGNVDIFEHTSVSCGRTVRGTARGVSEVLRLDGDRLVLEDGGRLVRFDGIDVLPTHCADDYFVEDATASFAILAATVEEHYVPGVDDGWDERRDRLASGIVPDTDAPTLLGAFVELLTPLDDPQLQVAPDESAGLGRGSWSVAIDPFLDSLADRIATGTGLDPWTDDGDGAIVSGRLPGGAGYLAFTRFAAIDADPDESEQIVLRAMDRLLDELEEEGAPGLVLDLRVAAGGVEGLALLAATRFVPAELALSERLVRVEGTDRFVDGGASIVRPDPTGIYEAPVVVLIGPGTFGAAEMLVTALSGVPSVTLLGEATAGTPSQPLIRVLPNTWAFGVPHQRVLVDGDPFQGAVEPDHVVEMDGTDLAEGRDPVLDAAAALLP